VKFELIPKSKAKTSWGLLRDVRKAMLAEPRRVDMITFVRDLDSYEWMMESRSRPQPACGTQGCIAGWMHLVTSTEVGKARSRSLAQQRAFQLLPESVHEDAARLFYDHHDEKGKFPYPWPASIPAGTPAYAKAVVRNLDKFMRKHERALRAFKLPQRDKSIAA